MRRKPPRIGKDSRSMGMGLVYTVVLLLFCMSSLCSAEWSYGYWKNAGTKYSIINSAKKEARDSKRPLLIALTKPTGCNNCLEYWHGVACDGKLHHDSTCVVASSNHPIVKYMKEKKFVMLYISPVSLPKLAGRIQGTEYKDYLHKPSFYPIYFIVKVKENADCTTEDENILNLDKVEFITGYLGIDGKKYYDYQGNETSYVAKSGTTGWSVFKSNLEKIFSNTSKTRGLTLDPPQVEDESYKTAEEMTFSGDNETNSTDIIMAKDKKECWFKFQSASDKKYWFKIPADTRGTTTDNLTFNFYKSTGSGTSLAPVTTSALTSKTEADGSFSFDGSANTGMVFLKLSRTTATAAYSSDIMYRRTTNVAGASLATASTTVTAGSWTTEYATAAGKDNPMVVAYVKNLWSDDAQALDAYVQTNTFKNAFKNANLVLISEPQDGITPAAGSAVEMFYVRSDGSVVGSLANMDEIASKFPQFADLAADESEGENNTCAGAMSIVFEDEETTVTYQELMIGGVDAVDWYKFNAEDPTETWIFTLSSDSDAAVTVSMTDSEGTVLKDAEDKPISASGNLKDGIQLNFKPAEGATRGGEGANRLKVTSDDIETPTGYTLFVERKVVNYTVKFESKTRKSILSSQFVEIPVTLMVEQPEEEVQQISVKVRWKEQADNLNCGLKSEAILEGNPKSNLTLKWTADELKSSTTKSVWLQLDINDDDEWDGHQDVALELTDVSDNAVYGEPKTMTVQVYATADQPMFEDGDSVSLELLSEGGDPAAQVLRIVAPETTEMFWECVKGKVPDGLDIILRRNNGSYELKLTPGAMELASGKFSIRLYSRVKGSQIKGGDTIEIGYSVSPALADYNSYEASGTMFAGTVFDNAESEISGAKDVSGTVEVAVEDNAIIATLTTSMGEVELTASEWTKETVENQTMLTATLTASKDGHDYELKLKVGEDGVFVTDGCELTVDKNTAGKKVYGVQGKALLQPQDYEDALVGFGDYYTADLQPVNTDDELTARTEGDIQGFGGMKFEINRENGTVAYNGFLPDGQRFEGTAKLRLCKDILDESYLEFTVFADARNGEDGTGQWLGSLNRICLTAQDAQGAPEICIACTNGLMEPKSHPVWYRDEGAKFYMTTTGSKFDRTASLSTQLSSPPDNRYYLRVDKPTKLQNGEAVVSPRRMELSEDEEGTCLEKAGESLFGVALAYSVARQGQGTDDEAIIRDGEFSGELDLYSKGFESGKKQTVTVHGILVSASQFCCSDEIHPVGVGYYLLEDDGVTTSYPVRIYWGKSLDDKEDVGKYLPEASAELSLDQANGVDLPADADKNGLNVSGLAEGGASLVFGNGGTGILAVSTEGGVEIFAAGEAVKLGGGHWTLCAVDLDGVNGEGKSMALTVSDKAALELSLKRGWNLIGVPWNVVSFAFDSKTMLIPYSMFTQADNAMIPAAIPLVRGKAYWVYAQEDSELRLAGEVDEGAEPKLPQNCKLYFGTDPGLAHRSVGWIWKDGRFAETAEVNPSQGGWWMIYDGDTTVETDELQR